MKANQNTVLVGQRVVLVPYDKHHVPFNVQENKSVPDNRIYPYLYVSEITDRYHHSLPSQRYHEWMLDDELRQLTASEPLSLDEEFEMQRKWREDDDKLTFIVLARVRPADAPSPEIGPNPSPDDQNVLALPMVGDVNMFLKGVPPIMRATDSTRDCEDEFEAEVEVMIAESSYRRMGLAREALQLMLSYATGLPSSYFDSGSSFDPSTRQSIPQCSVERHAVDACTPLLNINCLRTRDSPYSASLSPSLVDGAMIPKMDDERRSGVAVSSQLGTAGEIQRQHTLGPPLPIPPQSLRARISKDNHASQKLFSGLGFVTVRLVEVFSEVEMRWIRRW